ncbi:SPOR domain-containing protein [Tritonibacter horizontis]|uniref:Sporulation related domain protein n=1 Tax=Tritonibacter horizontis TaxID=1768241 RepID=A0A132C235_9RHOB|nr:SPOR domain-containing protein [Tritonibacter horizontis]KUP94100.1 sporulation related domain protein [Tritonibacter horizontis]
MAYFAQVGAGVGSSKGEADSGGSAFDPFSSHQYSRVPASDPYPQAVAADDDAAQADYPSFGYNAAAPAGRPAFGQSSMASPDPYAEAGYDYVDDYGDGYSSDEDALFGPPAAARGELGRMAAFLGAAVSLALVVSISVWGYKLIMRDVSGVPVVSAVAGPMRVAPEDPGGERADHQGLAVNAVAANGIAEDPADTLRLAPQTIKLTDDDQPIPALTEAAAAEAALEEEIAAEAENRVASFEEALPGLEEATSPIEQRSDDIDALVASLTEGAMPLEDLRETSASIVQPEPVGDVAARVAAAEIPATIRNAPGVRVTPRPLVRPARFAPASAPTNTSPATAAVQPTSQPARVAVDVSPESLAVGTRLAQLGAYESAEVARSEWTRISAKFGDYFDDKARVVQRAESGGRIFYRLRAHGFEDLSDARRFCSALVAGNADCIPVTMR